MFAAASEGAVVAYLAKAKTNVFPSVPQLKGNADPAFPGDPAAFIEKNGSTDQVKRFLTNKVKKCEACGKPNAFTLDTCNACGKSLVQTPIGSSNNVFMGFAFGIQKGPFPFTVSVRNQDENFLVIDDLLGLCPMHFNVIPTKQYLPDWRYLLRKPADGAELVKTMLGKCGEATKPFLGNSDFCKKHFSEGNQEVGSFPLTDIVAGFNYPPSQYQLHIQYMLPMLTPFHYANAIKGVHYTYKRFFPVGYVQTCLDIAAKHPLPSELLQDETPIEMIIRHFEDAHGHVYDKVQTDFMNKFKANQKKYSAWAKEDFEGYVVETGNTVKFHGFDAATPSLEGKEVDALNATDKITMQNYGRPYTEEGKTVGSYYSFPAKPEDITPW